MSKSIPKSTPFSPAVIYLTKSCEMIEGSDLGPGLKALWVRIVSLETLINMVQLETESNLVQIGPQNGTKGITGTVSKPRGPKKAVGNTGCGNNAFGVNNNFGNNFGDITNNNTNNTNTHYHQQQQQSKPSKPSKPSIPSIPSNKLFQDLLQILLSINATTADGQLLANEAMGALKSLGLTPG